MKRVYIVVEGQTEQEFVNVVLQPYLNGFGIYSVTPLLTRTSKNGRGGVSNYAHIKNVIEPKLKEERALDIVVTTMIDFFKIPKTTPLFELAMQQQDKFLQVKGLEEGINLDINDSRFFSYIQLHEFEALLFANNKGFEKYCSTEISQQTENIINSYSSPEDINSSPQSAPSKRILSIYDSYDKVLEGNIIALEVGISDMLSKCPRFKVWVEKIIEKAKK